MEYMHKVQYYETDKMGITHHSNYIRWMEEARVAFLEEAGYPFAKLEEMGIVSPVLSVTCEYKHPTTFADEITIIARVKEFKGVRLCMEYEMKNAAGLVVCIGTSSHAFLGKNGKPVRMKRDYPGLYEEFLKGEEKMAEFRKMRRFKQQLTDEECIKVLKEEPRGILALHGENGYPYAIPLNHFYDERDGKLYFHCAKDGLKLDLIKENNQVCFTVLDKGFKKEGDWALNIKSVVCLGHVEMLTDLEKILDHCRMLSKKFPVSDEEIEDDVKRNMNNVAMFVLTIDRMTGKLVNES